MKEQWIPSEETKEAVATYGTRLHKRMLDARQIVREHLKQEQQKQKTWHDKKGRELNLKEGDQVLLLLPDSSAKFTRKWQGTFEVQKKLGGVNCEKEIDKNDTKVYHVILLKKRFPPR